MVPPWPAAPSIARSATATSRAPRPPPAAAAPRTVRCRFCAEWIPAEAERCNYCQSFQGGYRSLLPVSAATVSALAALVSVSVLLFNTVSNRPPEPTSHTRVELFDSDNLHLYARIVNTGTAASFVGSAWMKISEDCDWSADAPPALCEDPAAAPPPGVVLLKAEHRRQDGTFEPGGAIEPGGEVVSFLLKGSLPAAERPDPDYDYASDPERRIDKLQLCVVFDVHEYRSESGRCSFHTAARISSQNYRPLLEKTLY